MWRYYRFGVFVFDVLMLFGVCSSCFFMGFVVFLVLDCFLFFFLCLDGFGCLYVIYL